MTDEYVFGPQVQRVMQGEGISPDELMEMLRKSAITSLRGFNRRYYDWLFKIQGRSVEIMQAAEMREVGRGKDHMVEECERCAGRGCKQCGWVGQISRRNLERGESLWTGAQNGKYPAEMSLKLRLRSILSPKTENR